MPKLDDGAKIEHVSRSIIEKRLLTGLETGAQVAILATEQDLELFIEALDFAECYESNLEKARKFGGFKVDLKKLRKGAFGR